MSCPARCTIKNFYHEWTVKPNFVLKVALQNAQLYYFCCIIIHGVLWINIFFLSLILITIIIIFLIK